MDDLQDLFDATVMEAEDKQEQDETTAMLNVSKVETLQYLFDLDKKLKRIHTALIADGKHAEAAVLVALFVVDE
jgi:hypothetical protein